MPRTSEITRNTNETRITLAVNLDGTGCAEIATGAGFLDHMLTLLAKHSACDMKIAAKGDTWIDFHHTTEDVGIALGQAVAQALGDKRGIRRYGFFLLPMDETLAEVAVDFGGRPYFVFNAEFPSPKVGDFDTELVRDFFHGFSTAAACNLHIRLRYGDNSHHIAEAIFKCFARAFRMAVEPDGRIQDVPSTKGVL